MRVSSRLDYPHSHAHAGLPTLADQPHRPRFDDRFQRGRKGLFKIENAARKGVISHGLPARADNFAGPKPAAAGKPGESRAPDLASSEQG
jgi:hypothetical protein